MNGIATLGKDENFSVFSFADKTIVFGRPIHWKAIRPSSNGITGIW